MGMLIGRHSDRHKKPFTGSTDEPKADPAVPVTEPVPVVEPEDDKKKKPKKPE